VSASSRPARERRSWLSGWFADRPVSTKILVAVLSVAVAALAVGVTGVVKLAAVNAQAEQMFEQNIVPLTELGHLEQEMMRTRLQTVNHATSVDPATQADYETEIQEGDAAFDAAAEAYEAGTAAPETLVELVAVMNQYRDLRDTKLLPASRAGDDTLFQTIRDTETRPLTARMEQLGEELFEAETADAEARQAAAQAAYAGGRTMVIAFLLAGLVLAVGLALYVSRLITRPLGRVNTVLAAVAAGDLTQSAQVSSRDEVGQMAAALDTATASMREALSAMAESATTLSSSSEELSAVSGQIAASAEETSAQSGMVSAAAGQVSSNVQTVAAGAEEMGAAIREISSNTSEAARVGASAVSVAETANSTVSKLGDSSAEIGNVVKVITSIAEQTNLLALNATIEAARAGEAGKGFAVVANEVKDLAQETAKATEDISRRVEAIQADTGSAVAAISEITAIIGRINDFQNTIASAVEEQSATTAEMSRNVAEAATGAGQIADNIGGVATAAQTTSEGVADSQRAAAELARLATELQSTVARFTY
jgi:methyl-accepting chemotaxis protein